MRRTILDHTPDGLKRRLADLERQVADLQRVRNPPPAYRESHPTPLPFHWPGQVDRFVDVRNGPGEFGADGRIAKIRYRWDTPPAGSATVQWWFDGTLVGTHTVAGDPHVERPGWAYSQQAIVAIVTAVGSDAKGLTAFVYLDA